jgi:uncharacterized RDD family membrane protein YckC
MVEAFREHEGDRDAGRRTRPAGPPADRADGLTYAEIAGRHCPAVPVPVGGAPGHSRTQRTRRPQRRPSYLRPLWFHTAKSSDTLTGMTIAPQTLATRHLAARRHRLTAFFIDSLIFYIAILPIYPLHVEDPGVSEESALASSLNPYAGNPDWPIEVAVTVLFAVYFWLQHALWGQTLGKRLYRLKVVSSTTGEPPSLRHAGIRALVHPALMSTPYSGLLINLVDVLWMFFGSKRQSLHDVISGTVVIDLSGPSRKGLGFLFGLGVILTLLTALILFISLVIPK